MLATVEVAAIQCLGTIYIVCEGIRDSLLWKVLYCDSCGTVPLAHQSI